MASLYSYTTADADNGTTTGTDTNFNSIISWEYTGNTWSYPDTGTGYNTNHGSIARAVVAPVDKDKQRDELRFKNKWSFLDFVDWVTRPRFVRRLRLPCADRAYGTTNGLRPVPMLC